MDTKVYAVWVIVFLFPFLLFTKESREKIDSVSEMDKGSPVTFTDCLKSKQIQLKKSDGSYMIRVLFSGKNVVSITDIYGKKIADLTSEDEEQWYQISGQLVDGETYIVNVKTPEYKVYKFSVAINQE